MASGFRVAQLGPWSTSRDWNLRATQGGETRLPFRFHVRQTHTVDRSTQDEFTKFAQLPVELQVHIMSFCDTATLWRLMRTSYSTREQALKMFWSDPTFRYVINGQRLFAGGHARDANYSLEALAHIRYLEVGFLDFTTNLLFGWDENEYHTSENVEQRAVFWTTLCRLFPRVVDIVLNENNSSRHGSPLPGQPIRLAMDCPVDITISVSQLRHDDKWYTPETRHLWRREHRNNSTPTWDLVESAWNPRRILPPTRRFSGPVGEYEQYEYDNLDLIDLRYARDIHAMHTTAAYYLHIAKSPCVCLWPTCGMQFNKPEDWMAHYLERCLRAFDHEGTVPLPPSDTIRAEFLRHDMMLAQRQHDLSNRKLRMKEAWGEPDSEECSEATQRFLQQLRDDPVYADEAGPEENAIWHRYQKDMKWDASQYADDIPSI